MATELKVKVGDAIRVLPHVRYQTLSHGAVIDPPIAHERPGYETTVRDILTDTMEDEAGAPVIEYTIVAQTGEYFSPDEVERIDA